MEIGSSQARRWQSWSILVIWVKKQVRDFTITVPNKILRFNLFIKIYGL
jgi:hypothetical protein